MSNTTPKDTIIFYYAALGGTPDTQGQLTPHSQSIVFSFSQVLTIGPAPARYAA